MAAYDYTRTPAVSSVIAGGVAKYVFNLIGAVYDWNDARKTRAALGKLSDRELDDIGLHRGDIEDVANQGQPRF